MQTSSGLRVGYYDQYAETSGYTDDLVLIKIGCKFQILSLLTMWVNHRISFMAYSVGKPIDNKIMELCMIRLKMALWLDQMCATAASTNVLGLSLWF